MTAVEKIHKSFLNFKQNLIDELTYNNLVKLGFKNSKDVIIYEDVKKHEESLNIAQVEYCNNLVFTEKQVKDLSHSNGLILNYVEKYVGHIPQKNVEEILNFRLKDIKHISYCCSISEGYPATSLEHITKLYHEWNKTLPNLIEEPLLISATPELFDLNIRAVVDDPLVFKTIMINNQRLLVLISKWGDEAYIDTINYKNN